MKTLLRSRQLLLITVGLLAFNSSNASAHDHDSALNYMTLNGLRAVALQIEGIQRDFTRFGLNADTILATTTKVLSDNGINVVDLDFAKSHPDAALMRIKLNANENQYRFYMYGISIELKQKLSLNNPAGGFISATIWRQGKTGVIMPTDLRQINDRIAELLAQFIDDYRSQNPKRVSIVQ